MVVDFDEVDDEVDDDVDDEVGIAIALALLNMERISFRGKIEPAMVVMNGIQFGYRLLDFKKYIKIFNFLYIFFNKQ